MEKNETNDDTSKEGGGEAFAEEMSVEEMSASTQEDATAYWCQDSGQGIQEHFVKESSLSTKRRKLSKKKKTSTGLSADDEDSIPNPGFADEFDLSLTEPLYSDDNRCYNAYTDSLALDLDTQEPHPHEAHPGAFPVDYHSDHGATPPASYLYDFIPLISATLVT